MVSDLPPFFFAGKGGGGGVVLGFVLFRGLNPEYLKFYLQIKKNGIIKFIYLIFVYKVSIIYTITNLRLDFL